MRSRELIAWILAAMFLLSTGVSLATRSARQQAASGSKQFEQVKQENRSLRAIVVELRSDGFALRAELDRLLAKARAQHGREAGTASAPATEGATSAPDLSQQVRSISDDIGRLSAEMATGDRDATKVLFQRISQLQAMGPEALPALMASFSEATDPAVRRVLASMIAMKGSATEEQFLLSAAERESDPQMKQALLANAGVLGGGGTSRAKDELLAMASSSDTTVRANAIRGFTDLSDPETATTVQEALADGSEEVRLAAVDSLMRDPAYRDEALEIAARDPSTRIRDIAECRARIADLEAGGE
jgi:HEAT repeat protein